VHLLIELITLTCFLASFAHACLFGGRRGLGLYGALLLLGLVRESFVASRGLLYGFAPLHLMIGKAPLIAAIIWAFSIYASLVWTEAVTGEDWRRWRLSGRLLGGVAMVMLALACFYEPVLKQLGMARWEAGTRTVLEVPLIAFVGYPSLACAFIVLWCWTLRSVVHTGTRIATLAVLLPVLGLAHASGLQALKTILGW
jgi:hypothetical protein